MATSNWKKSLAKHAGIAIVGFLIGRLNRLEKIKRGERKMEIDLDTNAGKLTVIGLIALIVFAIIFLGTMLVNVPAGHKTIVTDGFGVGHTFDEGWNIKNPLSGVTRIRYNTQELTESISVRTEDGYNVNADYTIRYHLLESEVSAVVTDNPDYEDTTILPELRSVARKVVSDNNWTGEDLNRERTLYEFETARMITPVLERYHIIAEGVLIRNIDFPETVDTAWQNRAASEVDVETAEFRLLESDLLAQQEEMIAKAEANATIILATGQAEALRILALESESLDNSTMDYILNLKYIQMLRDPENNVQFVLVTDGSGSPFILDIGDITQATIPEPEPAPIVIP